MSEQPAQTDVKPVPTVHEALLSVMADVRAVGKDDYNQQQKFKFRGVDAVVNAVAPALRKHGVICFPRVTDLRVSARPAKSGGQLNVVHVTVEYTFIGPSGDSITGSTSAEAMDSGDKATAKAMSVAYRTWWLQALCLPTDEPDPDHDIYETGNAVSGDVLPPEYQPPTNNPPQNQSDWKDEWNHARSFGPTGFVKFIAYCYAVKAPGPVRAALEDELERLNIMAREQGAPTATYDFRGQTNA